MASQAHITPELFDFFRDLAQHNDRDWFQEHKGRFEAAVKAPLQRFIVDFAPHLETISPHFTADPRPVGGSLFRIYRDTRFSKDKAPYKTNAGLHFRHAAGKSVHAPGFYLHLAPDAVFVGVGMWHPDRDALAAVRDAMVNTPERWTEAVSDKAFRRAYQLGGDSLKRLPRGYDPDHPLVDDLKRKDYVAICAVTEADACAPGFLSKFASLCARAAPFQRFLCEAVGVPF